MCALCVCAHVGWAVDYSGSPTSFSTSPSGNVTGSCGYTFNAGLQFRFVSAAGGNLYFETKMTSGNAMPVNVEYYIKEGSSSPRLLYIYTQKELERI